MSRRWVLLAGALVLLLAAVLVTGLGTGTDEDSPRRPSRSEPTATPTPTPTPSFTPVANPLLGIYNGGPRTDDAVRASFGAYPDVASTYYRGNQRMDVAAERARARKGIVPWLTVTSLDSGYTLADIGAGAADAWIDAYADDVRAIGTRLFLTFDHEYEVKANQRQFDETAASELADYHLAYNRFATRVRARAANASVGYWFGGFDQASVDTISAALVRPDWYAFDPYSSVSDPASETFEESAVPVLSWLRGRPWYDGQPIYLGEFGNDTRHGDAAVAAYLTDLRARVSRLGLSGALLFNRDRTDADGRYVAYRIDTGRTPQAQAAFGASLRQR